MSADGERFGPPAPFEPPAWVAEGLGRPTGKGIVVGVIDSGWDRACDDPRVLPGVGLVDPADDLAMLRGDDDGDRVGHGTACIHQILRIAPDARVVPIRVFGGGLETSPGTLQAGILYAIERGVNVVNLSLGTTLKGTLHHLYAACEKARRQGIIVVAAGHNSQKWSYPAIFENVIGVSAARFGSAYDFRYHRDGAMECEAWGVQQPVVWLGGEQQVKHGTSFAAPNITGIVCLFLERHPGASLEQVRALLAEHATAVVEPIERKAAKARAKAERAKARAKAEKAKAKVAKARARLWQAKAELAEARAELAEAKAAEVVEAKARLKAKAEPPEGSPAKTGPVEPGSAGAEPANPEPAGEEPTDAGAGAADAPEGAAPSPRATKRGARSPKLGEGGKAERAAAQPTQAGARAAAQPTQAGARAADAPGGAAPSPPAPKRRARSPKPGKDG